MAIFVHRIVPLALNRLPRVINGDDFHGAANLINPDFPVADHDALIADEQIVRLGGGDRRLDLGCEDSRVISLRAAASR
jgi:hypothetical protein